MVAIARRESSAEEQAGLLEMLRDATGDGSVVMTSSSNLQSSMVFPDAS